MYIGSIYRKRRDPNHGTQYNTDGLSITSDILNFYIEFIYSTISYFRNSRSAVHKLHAINLSTTAIQ